jgi:hypothetical protein
LEKQIQIEFNYNNKSISKYLDKKLEDITIDDILKIARSELNDLISY